MATLEMGNNYEDLILSMLIDRGLDNIPDHNLKLLL